MDWKETAWLWFTRAAQFWMLQTLILYLWACVVASRPIGPKDYIRFTYYSIQWQAQHTAAAPTVYAKER
jgi:hypothetical protein